jgi:hypothetical protein
MERGGVSSRHGQAYNHHFNMAARKIICNDLATGWTTEGSEFESRWGQEFSLLQIVQNGSEVHPTSYPMGTGGSFLGGKVARA